MGSGFVSSLAALVTTESGFLPSLAALVTFGSLALARRASARPKAATASPETVATRAASASPVLLAAARFVMLMVVLLGPACGATTVPAAADVGPRT